jgi:hypothetical protein
MAVVDILESDTELTGLRIQKTEEQGFAGRCGTGRPYERASLQRCKRLVPSRGFRIVRWRSQR